MIKLLQHSRENGMRGINVVSVLRLIFILMLASVCYCFFMYGKSVLDYSSFSGQKDRSLHRPLVHLDSVPSSQVEMLSEAGLEAYDGYVFMDWTLSADSFCYINYKSLESILLVYSKAKVVINLIAPFQVNYYKVGTLLNKHYFQKYVKQGHNVTVNLLFQQYGSALSDIHEKPPPGAAYWNLQMIKCCTVDSARSLRTERHVPFHQYFYSRVLSMYQRGGVFSDFTWLHTAPVKASRLEGVVLLVDCEHSTATITSMNIAPDCFISTLMVFPAANNPVLLCVLHMFDAVESAFMQCITNDSAAEGAHCLSEAFQRCFKQNERGNMLLDQFLLSGDLFADSESRVDGAMTALHHRQLWKAAVNPGKTHAGPLKEVEWLGRAAHTGDWQLPETGSLLDKLLVRQDAALAARNQFLPDISAKCALNESSSSVCHHFQARTDKRATLSLQHARQASVSCAPHFALAGFMKAGTTHLFELLMAHPQLLRALRGVLFKETGCYLPAQMATADKAGQRMSCFPFLEEADQGLRFGDGTVYYAARKELPGYLLADNPDVRVLFAVRHPVHRSESQHRFNYQFYLSKGLGDLNLCVSVALDRSRGPLMDLFDLAQRSVRATSGEEREGLVGDLVKRYQAGMARSSGRGQQSQQYLHCANLLFHSLYFPAIQHWAATLPRPLSRLLVVSAERLDVGRWNVSQKLAALRRPAGHMSTNAFAAAVRQYDVDAIRSRDGHGANIQEEAGEKGEAERRLNEEYLRIQLNAIAEFLGICPWTQALPVVDTHKSGGKIVPPKHRLNETSRASLRAFYHPFNWLLDSLLNESFSYNN